jgi:hypothetical protein
VKSPGGKAAVALAGLALVVVLFLLLQGSDDDDNGPTTTPAAEQTTGNQAGDGSAGEERNDAEPKPEPEIATIVVRNGEPVGGVAELTFTRGERIRFAVESDVVDHVHLHGYNVMKDVEPGQRVTFDVPATIEGVFEVELEDRVVPLAEIAVQPG